MRELRFVITPFCNYRCFFCHGENACRKISLLLSPKDYEFMACTVKHHFGWNTATITGGEPLISPIFSDVCRRLKSNGISTTVITNASLLARPSEMLADISQVNISLHTTDPTIYERIVQVRYPLEDILSTITRVREQLPSLIIHLNYTVIRGVNDTNRDFEAVIDFARGVRATVKFIDLSTQDANYATDAAGIVQQLCRLGFLIVSSTPWQFFLSRGGEEIVVTKCPFNGRHTDAPIRDVFVDADGVIYTSYGSAKTVSALEDVKSRDPNGLLQKISSLLS